MDEWGEESWTLFDDVMVETEPDIPLFPIRPRRPIRWKTLWHRYKELLVIGLAMLSCYVACGLLTPLWNTLWR